MDQEAVSYDFDEVHVYRYTSHKLLFHCGVIMLLSSADVEFYIFCDGFLDIDNIRNDALRH